MPKTPHASDGSHRSKPAEASGSDFAPIEIADPAITDSPPLISAVNRIAELGRRPARSIDHKNDSNTFESLAQSIANSPDSVFEELADSAVSTIAAGSAFVWMPAYGSSGADRFTASGVLKDSIDEAGSWLDSLCHSIVNDGESVLLIKPQENLLEINNLGPEISEMLLAPVLIGTSTLGVFGVVSYDAGRQFDDEDFRLLQSYCCFAAAAALTTGRAAKSPRTNAQDLAGSSDGKAKDERFVKFMQNLPGLAWIKDENGRYVYVNNTAAETFGRPISEILGKTDDLIFPDETARLFIDNDRAAIESGSGIQTEELLRDPSGILRHSLVTKFPIPDPDKGSLMIGGMAIDITERRQIEKDQAFLFTVAEMIRLRSDPGQLLTEIVTAVGGYLQLEQCLFFELSEDKTAGTLLAGYSRAGSEIGTGFDLTSYNSVNLEALLAGHTIVNRNSEIDPQTADYFDTVYAPRKEIAFIWVPLMRQADWIAVFCCTDSRPRNWTDLEVGLLEAVGERTWTAIERLRAESLLRTSEERMRVLSDSFTDYAIMAMDVEGRIDSWNTGAANIFGFDESEMLGQPVDVLFTPQDVMKGVPLLEMRKARQKGRASDERWHVRKDGSRFFASGVTAPLYVGNVLVGYAKIATDLTEKKRNSEALQRAHDEMELRVAERTRELAGMNEALLSEINERKTAERQKIELLRQLVSTQEDERRRIARDLHDHLGQRLTGLRLNLASLKEECGDNEELADRIVRIQQIAGLLDSEVSFITWELTPSALDELGLVEAIHTFVKEWSRHYEIEAEFHVSGIADAGFTASAEIQIYRIVQEALNNTVKHASATRVGVILERTGDTATLIIEDNGIGFDPAVTIHPDPTIGGLGIAGMRERAELVGGKLEIETGIGKGTAIYVRVPVKPIEKR